MKLVKTSLLAQQDRRQDRMQAWLTGPKADAFWFLTAPEGAGGSARQQAEAVRD